jgi:hypothetical protein
MPTLRVASRALLTIYLAMNVNRCEGGYARLR